MHMTIDGLRKALDAGELSNIPRATFHAGIQAVAKNIRNDNETEAQAYTRAITQTEIGKLLFAAHQNAPLIKVAPASGFAGAGEPKAPGDTPEKEMGLGLIGPAHKEMHALAIDYQRSRGNTYAAAYSHVYSHSDNAPLREKVRAEHLASVMKGTGIY